MKETICHGCLYNDKGWCGNYKRWCYIVTNNTLKCEGKV